MAPRAKRMNRSARLQSARTWLKTYRGRNIASGYRKHFGIDWVCAFKELDMLGVKIDEGYKNNLLKSVAGGVAARRRRRLQRKVTFDEFTDQDENFACIVGYTEAGFAYGVTWEEWERIEQENSNCPEAEGELVPAYDSCNQLNIVFTVDLNWTRQGKL